MGLRFNALQQSHFAVVTGLVNFALAPPQVIRKASLTSTLTSCEHDRKSLSEAAGTKHGSDQIDPDLLKKLTTLRAQVREGFGKVVMSMMGLPRYRHQSVADLQHLVLEPLIRDRVAIAYPQNTKEVAADIAGLAIWASVSDEVDAKIREQIRAGAFPIRLKPEDWTSGDNNWLLDVIAPDQKATLRVIANFKQVVKDGDLRLHPLIGRLVDRDTLEKMLSAKDMQKSN